MGFGIKVEAWGDYALFTRPELKTERVSYDVITPSAARGILEAVMWHPGMKWVIDGIRVCNPIRFTNIRRNEIKEKVSASNMQSAMNGTTNKPLYISASDAIQQRASMVLRDVRYVITAHFEMTDKASPTDTPEKFYAMTAERLKKGKTYHHPYFGCREFPAQVRLVEDAMPPASQDLLGTRELGFMLYDMDYAEPGRTKAKFFRATLIDGDLKLRDTEVFT